MRYLINDCAPGGRSACLDSRACQARGERSGPGDPRPAPHTTWSDYGGGADASQYSALKQINGRTSATLQVAWKYPTGDGGGYLFNPIVVDGVDVRAGEGRLDRRARRRDRQRALGLSRTTGRRHVARHELLGEQGPHRSGGCCSRAASSCRRSTRSPARRSRRSATTAASTCGSGLDRDPREINAQSNTPGRVFEDLLILGSATNQGYNSAPGDIRAFDVRTGKLVWTFHTVPRPGRVRLRDVAAGRLEDRRRRQRLGRAHRRRGRAASSTCRPAARNTTSTARNRIGANLFGDCLLALDARTGKRLWHFQMVHHDIWDYDNATAPKLLTIRHNGQMVDVVAQAGKTGFLYVFNRVTGEPIWPIEERPVPKSDVPGEQAWPTQPFPTAPPPFARQSFTEKDLSPYIDDPAEKARFLEDIRGARNEGLFTPPGLDATRCRCRATTAGRTSAARRSIRSTARWSSSRRTGRRCSSCRAAGNGATPAAGDGRRSSNTESPFGFMITSSGLTAIAPPWTSMTAYDLNTGTIKWKMPLGEVPELAAKGITDTGSHFPKVGPVVTAGGLIFTGTRDRKIRALDVDTGKVLWTVEVEAGVEGIPAVYEVNGKQYIVYCAAAQATTPHASADVFASRRAARAATRRRRPVAAAAAAAAAAIFPARTSRSRCPMESSE